MTVFTLDSDDLFLTATNLATGGIVGCATVKVTAAVAIYATQAGFMVNIGRCVITIVIIVIFKGDVLIGVAAIKCIVIYCRVE